MSGQAAREQAAREQAAREQAAREQAVVRERVRVSHVFFMCEGVITPAG